MSKFFTALLGPLALVLVASAGCGMPSQAPEGGSQASALRLADNNEPESLNPLEAMFGVAQQKIYEGLFDINAEGGLDPRLATASATASDDLRTWTVDVRPGHKFSDGSAVTAEDVAATYRALVDPAVGSPLADLFSMLETVTTDGDQVTFGLRQPYAPFETLLTIGIGPAEKIGQRLDSSVLNTEPMGSGPYQLDTWRSGDSMVLTANPHFAGAAPQVDRIIIAFVADQNAVAQRLRAGELDGAQLPPSLARTFVGDGRLSVWQNPTADFRAITFPREDENLRDPRVRRALNMAVDREAMVEHILFGYGHAASTPFTRAAHGDLVDSAQEYPFDPQQAAGLLDGAGFTVGPGGVRERDGRELRFTVMYFPEDLLRRDLAQAFASDLNKIGVAVDLEAVGRSTFGDRIRSDAAVFGGGDMPYDPDTQVHDLLSGVHAPFDPSAPYRNPSGYDNATVTAALDQGRSSGDPRVREDAYRTVQETYLNDPALVVLVALEHTYVADLSGWQGVEHVIEPHDHGVSWGPWWNVESWTRT